MAKLPDSSFPPEGDPKQKKPRKVTVKNARFFLYKRYDDNEDLSPMDSFEAEIDLRIAYAKALDEDIPENLLVGFKGRFLEFKVTEKKRKVAVK